MIVTKVELTQLEIKCLLTVLYMGMDVLNDSDILLRGFKLTDHMAGLQSALTKLEKVGHS